MTLTIVDTEPTIGKYKDQGARKRLKIAEAHKITRGAGVIVAVLDTGVDKLHPALAGHIAPGGWDFVDNDGDPSDRPNGRDDDNDGVRDEATGHGTHVAGIIALGAPAAKILPIRVLNSEGIGTAANLARGIRYAVNHGAKVINLSLGVAENSDTLNEALNFADDRNCLIIASAGNDNGEVHYPAADSKALGVAAVNALDKKAPFSNYGSDIVVSAPGVGIYSAFPGGRYAWWTGTSMAAPFVSAEAALVFSFPGHDAESVAKILEEAVIDIDGKNPAYDGELGEGRIDFLKAVQLARSGEDKIQ